MAMTITPDEIENAALVVIVDEDGRFRWSSTKTDDQVAEQLEGIAECVRATSIDEPCGCVRASEVKAS